MEIPLYLIAIVILLAFSALFSATETAFTSLNKVKIKNLAAAGNKKASRVLALSENFERLISSLLIGNNIVNITATTLSGLLFAALIKNGGVASTVSTVVMTVTVLIFGEISPKTLAKRSPEYFALSSAGFIKGVCVILFPLTWLFGLWQKLLNKTFKSKGNNSITDDELKTYVEEAQTGGGIDEYESELIRSAIEFNDLTVKDILTPRVDVIAVDKSSDMEYVLTTFRQTGFSRLPVYEGSIDNIIGVLNEKDFFSSYLGGKTDLSEAISSNILYATPFMKINVLLRKLQKAKTHMAVVVDEFGGTQGIATLEDILEELVGDIWDEHDEVIEYFQRVSETKFNVIGDVNLEEFFEFFGIKENAENYDAVQLSGFVVIKLGKIPQPNDSIDFHNLKITVTKTEHMKVAECEIEILPDEEQEEEK